ncbi:MAG: phenylacetate--CoA ligase family protein [Candidatus Liptonbacteria bacterium]|nr:phenylacetate--CoA ligase family protein [Candidatus Liptonbacteria bacterium]
MNERDWTPPYSAEKILRLIKTKKDDFWSRERERRPLRLFHEAAARVPAYKDFLRKNRVNPAKIKTWKDFQNVPAVSKKNYLREYPLEKLSWDGTLKKPLVFTSTSGSTGEPFYFPRGEKLDWEYSILAEMFLKNSSKDVEEPVIVINGFAMGVWIGGVITYKAFEIASHRGEHPVSIINPGINKSEIFHALRNLAPYFKQTILVGYPPFVKDVIDEAIRRRINLKKINLRILFAAEAFGEKFREYVGRKASLKNLYLDTLNIYGTADIGAMAWETPVSILIRRLAVNDERVFGSLFSQIQKIPTLAQYNPLFITFESPNHGDILLTGDNTVPLIRYVIGDHGGVMNFGEAVQKLKSERVNLSDEVRKKKIEKSVYKLPFVYVYERSDFSTKLYGAIIYPEPIRESLHHDQLERFVTGKFTMLTKFDKKQNQFLEIHIELKPRARSDKKLKMLTRELIVSNLLEKNAEYRSNHSSMPHKVLPEIIFWRYEHPLHFKPGTKQKWVKKVDNK